MRVKTKDEIKELVEIVDSFPDVLAESGYEFRRSRHLPVELVSHDGDPTLTDLYKIAAYEILESNTDAVQLDEVKAVREGVAQELMDSYYQGNPLPPIFSQQDSKKDAYDLTSEELYKMACLIRDGMSHGILASTEKSHLHKRMQIIANLTAMNILNFATGFGSGGQDILTSIVKNYLDNHRVNADFYRASQIEEAEKKAKAAHRQIERIYRS